MQSSIIEIGILANKQRENRYVTQRKPRLQSRSIWFLQFR